jgi:predicted GNAT family acetyltransferase
MSAESAPSAVRDNREELRFELVRDGEVVAEILYRLRPDAVALVHTEVEPKFEGRGFGSELVAGALDDIRARREHVIPICPFVRAYIRRHPEYNELVVRDPELGD